MALYLIVFLLLCIPVLRYDLLAKEGGEGLWYYFSLLILIAIAGFRYRVGGDTIVYMELFEDYPTLSELRTFDFNEAKFSPMWYIYNAPFRSIGSFTLYQIVQAIIVNCCFFRFFRRYSKYYFSLILLYFVGYFFYFNMEIQREVLCICLLLDAYPLLEKRRYLPYYLICALAFSFHFSAVVMMVIPLMKLVKKESWLLCLIISAAIFILLGAVDIVSIVLSVAFDDRMAVVVRNYLARGQANLNGGILLYLIAVPFMMLMYLRQQKKIINDEFMGRMLILVCVFQTIGIFINSVNRFSNYLMPFGMVYILNTFYLNYSKIRYSQWSTLLMTGIFVIYFFNLSYFYIKDKSEDLDGMKVINRYVPYYSIFNPQEDSKRERLIVNERTTVTPIDQ